jgi:hypothetical protein
VLPGLSEQEFKRLLLSVGTHRSERVLTPCEVGFLFQKAINNGATLHDCAKAVLLEGSTWISRFLRTLKLDRSVRHLVGWGQSDGSVAFTSATEVARLNKREHEAVFTSILESNLSSKEVRELVQIRLRSGRAIQECIAEVIALRPQVVRQHVFVGAIKSPELKAKLRSKTQMERDEIFKSIVLRRSAPLARCIVKLGVDNFALITDDEGASHFKTEVPDFESEFNTLLESHF